MKRITSHLTSYGSSDSLATPVLHSPRNHILIEMSQAESEEPLVWYQNASHQLNGMADTLNDKDPIAPSESHWLFKNHSIRAGVMVFMSVLAIAFIYFIVYAPLQRPANQGLDKQQTDFLFTIISHKGERDRWETVINYWKREIQNLNIDGRVLLFSCSDRQSISNELALLECDDSYEGLFDKLKAVRKYAEQSWDFKYLVKVDSDVILNTEKFRDWIQTLSEYNMYGGYFYMNKPIPTVGKKPDLNLRKIIGYFPKYASGPFYVLSKDLVTFLVQAAQMPHRKFRNEDVYVGFMLAWKDNVNYVPMERRQIPDTGDCEGTFCHSSGMQLALTIMQKQLMQKN